MIIDALMYGVIDIAKIVALLNAPPDIMFRKPSKEFPAPVDVGSLSGAISSFNAATFRNGTGIAAPIRKMTMIIRVNRSFLRSSGIFHAFRMV